jgi:hypothetical protein
MRAAIIAAVVMLTSPAMANDCQVVNRERRCTFISGHFETVTWSDMRGNVQRMTMKTPDTGRDAAGWLALMGLNMQALVLNGTREQRAELLRNLMQSMANRTGQSFRHGAYSWTGVWTPDKAMTIGAERVRPSR